MSTIIEIEQISIEKPTNKVEVVIPYRLGAEDLTAYVHFKTDDGIESIKVLPVYITPEEYSLWTDSDEYIENIIFSKAGIVRKISES